MDAIKFMKEKKRMCNSYSACTEACLLKKPMDENRLTCIGYCFAHPEDAVAIVEKWSKDHPKKTRQSELLKMFPNAEIENGIAVACPKSLDKNVECEFLSSCDECTRKYWLEEVE